MTTATATATATTKDVDKKRKSLPELLNDAGTAKRFQQMLGKDARSFQQNILTVYNSSKQLAEADPESIIAACEISASVNLSILPSLGHSAIVPYREGKDGPVRAQWQIMTKGVIQLALRSKQIEKINLAPVYEGQLKKYDPFKNLVELDYSGRTSDRVVGFYFYFKLTSGMVFESYWSVKKCVEHGLRYSKSFQDGKGKWTEDPEYEKAGTVKKWLAQKEGQHFLTEGSGAYAMSAKTAVKNDLLKWAPLETRISEVVALDQAVIGPDGKAQFIDSTIVEEGQEAAAGGKTYTPPPQLEKGKEPTPAEKLAWARGAAKKQGVEEKVFDAWLAQQPGDEAAQAAAVEALWKRVTAKEVKAVDAFRVADATEETEKKHRATEEEPAPKAKEVSFAVSMVAGTTIGDDDVSVIRDTSEPPVKYYTDNKEYEAAAKKARKDEERVKVTYVEKKIGKDTYRWIVTLA